MAHQNMTRTAGERDLHLLETHLSLSRFLSGMMRL
jgi:hypothetical protein